jgi:hypothetical protein
MVNAKHHFPPVLALLCCAPCFAQDARKDDRLAQFVLAGVKHGASQLKSGAFRAHGRFQSTSSRTGQQRIDELQIFSAFDFEKGLLRFDRVDKDAASSQLPNSPPRSFGPTTTRTRQIPTQPLLHDLRLVRTPDRLIHWVGGNPSATIDLPTAKLAAGFGLRFDVRSLGFCNYPGLRATFDELYPPLLRDPVDEAVEEANGVYRVSWLLAQGALRSRVWFDPSKDFAAIRMEESPRSTTLPHKVWEPTTVSDTTWTRVNNTWVPKTYHIEVRRRDQSLGESYDLAFNWEQVNEPVRRDLFTWEGMGLPEGTRIVDARLGRDRAVELARAGEIPETIIEPESHGLGAWWVVLTACALLAMWLVVRGRRRRSLGSRT